MIERNQVDVGITSFYANSGRGQVVDFSPILEVAYFDKSICIKCKIDRNKFFVKFPGRESVGVFMFLKGFSNDTWLAPAVFIFVIPAFLCLTYMVTLVTKVSN